MPIEVTSVDLQPPSGELLGRNIELPRAGTLIDGEAVTIVGWAIGRDSPIVAVEAVAHDEAVVSVPVDTARPDLADAFPDAPGAATGGFKFTVALGAMPNLALTLQAVDEDGRRIAVGSVDAYRRWPAADQASGPALVSVVVTSLDQADELAGALDSIARQTYPHLEVAVVDAGSSDNVGRVVAQTPGVELVRIDQHNVAAARNAGFAATTGSLVLFLDAADRLVPDAVETALRELADHPEAAFVSGRARLVGNAPDAAMLPQQPYVPADHYTQLLQENYILNHGAVVYRRPVLADVGLFDDRLRNASEYDMYLRIAARYAVTSHTDVVVDDSLYARREERPAVADSLAALARQEETVLGDERRARALAIGRARLGHVSNGAARGGRLRGLLRDAEPKHWPPPVGAVDLGHLTSVEPLDPNFGYGRGTPIDRYYIERFLEQRAADVAGRVLEVQENDYTMRFGGSRVTQSDVLHLVAGNPRATIVGDLADPATLPEATFDCVILTQTLHLVTDPPAALRSIARALVPGGALLLTTPGITRVEWGESWYWSFTSLSLRKLLRDAFGPAHLELESHGNVHAATGFLHGLAVEETEQGRLDYVDLSYPVVLTARARRR
jgi:SAM-dependent methyltransferase